MRGEISFVLRSSTYGGKKKEGRRKEVGEQKEEKRKKSIVIFFVLCLFFLFLVPPRLASTPLDSPEKKDTNHGRRRPLRDRARLPLGVRHGGPRGARALLPGPVRSAARARLCRREEGAPPGPGGVHRLCRRGHGGE